MPTRVQQQRRPQKRKKRRLTAAGKLYRAIVVLSAIIVGVYVFYRYMTRLPPITDHPAQPSAGTGTEGQPTPQPVSSNRKEGWYTFLLCATDHGNGGTDTMIVVAYDTVNQKVNMVSIPRDTIILNSRGNVRKLNSSYNNGGVDGVREAVSQLLGIPLDYYIKIDLQGFVEAVDAVGPISFEIPCDMNYDDDTPGQELHIHYTAGVHELTGEQAMEVVRFRYSNDGSGSGYNDTGRMETQRNFILAVLKQTLRLSNIAKVPELAKIAMTYVETDLTLQEMTAFGNQVFTGLDLNTGITSQNLPGDYSARIGKGWYVALDPQGTLDVVNQYLNPYKEDRTMSDLTIHTLNSNGQVYLAQ